MKKNIKTIKKLKELEAEEYEKDFEGDFEVVEPIVIEYNEEIPEKKQRGLRG